MAPLNSAQQKKLRANRDLDDTAIVYFGGEYAFLSNFWRAPVTLDDGVMYRTAEHAFQAQKATNAADRARVVAAAGPGGAKAVGGSIAKVPGWFGEGRKEAMRKVLAAKVRVCPQLRPWPIGLLSIDRTRLGSFGPLWRAWPACKRGCLSQNQSLCARAACVGVSLLALPREFARQVSLLCCCLVLVCPRQRTGRAAAEYRLAPARRRQYMGRPRLVRAARIVCEPCVRWC
jgi:predicted NAD-dependent protein-ADP-ribosyltransferase YbiA (DUF1768 family)